MLVTDPKQRAAMAEVMSHPWMVKGYSGPPENFLPAREPLELPLENEVITAMTGFNFGSPDNIKAQLTRVIESEDYQRALRLYQREKELPPLAKDVEKKRGFGFDFYKRRNSGTSRDTLTAPSSEALQLGSDPLNAFSPLISIYHLVKEKQDRDRIDFPPQVSLPHREHKSQKDLRDQTVAKDHAEQKDSRSQRDQADYKEKDRAPLEIAPPQAAHTNTATYEMPGERATGGRSRPRARTHGEDDAPEASKQQQLLSPTSANAPESHADHPQKKESTAAGLLRRFSTRRRREPERLDKDRAHPPVVQVRSPSEAPIAPRKSFSMRRSRREEDDVGGSRTRSGSSQPQQIGLLSPPPSAGGAAFSRRKGLGRSTSVNSGDLRRRDSSSASKEPPPTSGSDQSTSDKRGPDFRGSLQTRSASMRTKSLGHARRESIQQRRLRREEARAANVPEETDQDAEDQSGLSTERLDSSDLAKPVYLKGLFSVSTTSGKSVPEIRADIKRVLKGLGVDYMEIKGGFSCRHSPSIDLRKTQDAPSSPAATSGHRRRFSFGAIMSGADREREGGHDADRTPGTPRIANRAQAENDYSNSDVSDDSVSRDHGSSSRRVPAGETRTHVQSDLDGDMTTDFEIFIVKVPLLSLHGIQFKRLVGNTWQYKNLADQVLRELRL
jgi:serine/threonine protein kinase KIN1/2